MRSIILCMHRFGCILPNLRQNEVAPQMSHIQCTYDLYTVDNDIYLAGNVTHNVSTFNMIIGHLTASSGAKIAECPKIILDL